jgi:putative sigma-54 modulation protein
MKPMTVGEAILQLDLLHDPFLVFMNAESQQVNVVYSKEDGSYAVVEPQY